MPLVTSWLDLPHVPAIAKIFECHEHTVRATLRRWENRGLGGLWETSGRGVKCKWQDVDLAYLEDCLEVEPRTYNSLQLSEKLAQHRNVQLSPSRLRRLLKKKRWKWKRTRHTHKGKQNPEKKRTKQADLDTLKQAAIDGYVELKYLDESGCCRWSPVSYSYARIGGQKQMAQVGSRSGRISILGLWEPQVSFDYALVQGGFKTKGYIEFMDWVAAKAQNTFAENGRITVIVHDNGSLHTSNLAKQRWQEWQEKGLFIFFLPPYCSEMNRIEEQWHQLKTHEIAGQMFDNNYDLAMAIIDGMEARSIEGEYTLERLIFNCA